MSETVPPGAAAGSHASGPHTVSPHTPGPQTAALRADLFDDSGPDADLVRVVDTHERRVRHPSDALGMIMSSLGIALVLLLSALAQRTVQGAAADVHGFGTLLGDILQIPVINVLDGVVTFVLPIVVLGDLAVRRLGRQVVESIAAAALGIVLGLSAWVLIREFGSAEFVAGLSVRGEGTELRLQVPVHLAGVVALLTVAGPRTRRRTVRWFWNLTIVTMVIFVITDRQALPIILLTLLVGRLAGQAVQWLSGVRSERAYGPELVQAVRRAGFRPTALVRVRDLGAASRVDDLATFHQNVPAASGMAEPRAPGGAEPGASPDHETVRLDGLRDAVAAPVTTAPAPGPALAVSSGVAAVAAPSDADAVSRSSDPAAVALARQGDNRVYAMLNEDGARYDVVVLDGDRQVVDFVTRIWRALRMRGIEGRTAISLKAVAERTSLLSYAAGSAGVRTPRLLGLGMAEDSAALVMEHARGAVSLRDLHDDELEGERGDAVMADAWDQLRRAHAAGLTHHKLTSDVLLVHHEGTDDGDWTPRVWITGWEQGEVASTTLSRRLDLTQMLALLALRVGPQRAVASAVRALPDSDISAIGPLLQTIALPTDTRVAVRHVKGLMNELRSALVERLPEANVQPQRLTRFSARTIITLALTIIAVVVAVTTIQFDEIRAAVQDANPWWIAVTFGLSGLTWFGAALTVVAFSPGRIAIFKATLAQMAGSFVALATPAGIGPAALNLRFLNRQGVSLPMAVATVALVQFSQFVVTVVLLVVLSLATGSGALIELPGPTLLIAIAVIAAVVIVLLLVPSIRGWAWSKTRPTIEQLWPRLSEMLGQPTRLALGLGGNVIMTMGYVLAFNASLMAFGRSLSMVEVAVIYLFSNTLGAMVPTPGGVGAVDFALAAGLTTAGIPTALATSVAFLFRLCSYWARIPLGWFAMRYLERKEDL